MRKVFKSKRKRNNHFLLWILIVIFSFYINIEFIRSFDNEYLIDNNIHNIKLDKDRLLLNLSFGIDTIENKKVFHELTIDDKYNVYIYNTHQSEEYSNYNVYDASLYLSDLLSKYNINTLVEHTNINDAINVRGYTYRDSYKVTRELMQDKIDKFDLLIDFHRDSSNKNITTYDKYAKIMFVVGGKHETYLNNYQVAEELNDLLKLENENLSRGIFVRKSSSYNQDLGSNILLIEVGGVENTKEEINNTLEVLASIINYYLSE